MSETMEIKKKIMEELTDLVIRLVDYQYTITEEMDKMEDKSSIDWYIDAGRWSGSSNASMEVMETKFRIKDILSSL